MGRLDSRILLWCLFWALLSGALLMVPFASDAAAHRDALGAWGGWLRGIHAAATLLILVGALWHLAKRWRDAPHRVRSGGAAFAAVAFASITGAFVAQTEDAMVLLGLVGLVGMPLGWIAVLHIAYATILVVVAVVFHLAGRSWRYLLGSPKQGGIATGLVLVLAGLGGPVLPGDEGSIWTRLAVPPWPAAWAWSLLVGLVLVIIGWRRLRRA